MNKKKGFFIGANITAIYMGITYALNKFVFYSATMKELLQEKNQSYYNWRFGNIYYTKEGEGKPVLMVHHLDATGSEYEWRALKKQLVKHHTVYTIDLPGCGRSEKEKMLYTNYLYVQAINDFVKNIIKSKVDLISSGDSSSIVLMACHSEPIMYKKIIMINPEPLKKVTKIKIWHKLLRCFNELYLSGTLLYTMIMSKKNIKKRFMNKYYADFNQIDDNDIMAFYEAAHLGGFKARYAYISKLSGYTKVDFSHALKMLNNSVYLIAGEEQQGIDETIENYKYFNPAIESVIIPKTKGMPHMEKTDEVASICELYLND